MITEGLLQCDSCGGHIPVREGIVCLLDERHLDGESAHERHLRDTHADQELQLITDTRLTGALEMGPTLAALEPGPGRAVLELGCGTGRYTTALSETGAAVLAVDFSAASLRILARQLPAQSAVGLVHADITRLRVGTECFSRCLSTLVSNLPTPAHRQAMFQLAATALERGGRFVFGVHHFGLGARLRSVARQARYSAGGIYREYFRHHEIRREAGAAFQVVRVRPIQVLLPGVRRLGLSPMAVSRLAERIPLLREFGDLLLGEAEQPLVKSLRGVTDATPSGSSPPAGNGESG